MIIIGIIGKKESGKTTFSNYLKEYFFSQEAFAIKEAFGDELKKMLVESGLCTDEEVYQKKTPLSRMLMQKIGTEIVRTIDYDYWCKIMWEKLKNDCLYDPRCIVIIDDVRFQNEYNMLRSLGAIIIKVERPQSQQEDNHASETEMDGLKYDAIVYNDSNLHSLMQKADAIGKTVATKGSVNVNGNNYSYLLSVAETTTIKNFNKEVTKTWRSYSRLQAFWQ
jgi:hypothetical protein